MRVIFYLLASSDFARLVDAPKNSPERAIRRSTRINTELSTSWRLRGWFVVAHVCARWRALSLGQPALWTVIDINLGPSWVDAFIARSSPLPFVFQTKPKGSGYNKHHAAARDLTFNKILREHASRMGQLNVDAEYLVSRRDDFNRYTTDLPDRFFQQYPVLEVLTIHGSSISSYMHSWASFSAPRVQKLSLQGVKTFPWDLPALWRITHLVVRSFMLSNTEKVNMEACLATMPSLKQLYLDGVLPDNRTDRTPRLPHIQRLGLRDAGRRLQAFLQYLEAPSLRAIGFTHLAGYSDNHIPFDTLMSSALAHVPATNFTDLTVVRSMHYPRVHISLRACESAEDVGLLRTYSDGYTSGGNVLTCQASLSDIDTSFLALDDAVGETGRHILELSSTARSIAAGATPEPVSLPFPNVQTVRVIGDWKPQEISESFSTMTGVKHLRLYDPASFFAFSTTVGDSSSGLLFPQLDTLSIAYSEASQAQAWVRSRYPGYGSRDTQDPSPYARLDNLVKARVRIERPLRAIYLHQADAFISAIREHASSTGADCSLVVDLIQEDQGMRRWYDSEKKQYQSNDPRWC